jgi:hypothetical protein
MVTWSKPRYPGDRVFSVLLLRGRELGSVDIRDDKDVVKPEYGRFRVGAYLPGEEQFLPGDTPKVWPEYGTRADSEDDAIVALATLVDIALRDGWSVESRR